VWPWNSPVYRKGGQVTNTVYIRKRKKEKLIRKWKVKREIHTYLNIAKRNYVGRKYWGIQRGRKFRGVNCF
jgi:hypothetical protein